MGYRAAKIISQSHKSISHQKNAFCASKIDFLKTQKCENDFVALKNDFPISSMKNTSDGGVNFECAKNIFPKN